MLISQKRGPSKDSAPYSDVIQRYVNEDNVRDAHDEPIFGTSNVAAAADSFLSRYRQIETNEDDESTDSSSHESGEVSPYTQQKKQHWRGQVVSRIKQLLIFIVVVYSSSVINKNILSPYLSQYVSGGLGEGIFDEKKAKNPDNHPRPKFVYAHPYVTSSYYTATSSIITLEKTEEIQIEPRKDRLPDRERGITSRLAIVRPFCEFDADALPTTFACWNSLVPCRAAEEDLGEDGEDKVDEWVIFDMSVNGTGRKLQKGEEDNWECETDYGDGDSSWFGGITSNSVKRCKKKPRSMDYFDDVPADGLRTTSADLFLFYSQTFSENEVAMHAVDEIMNEYFSPGGWSRCFDNIYAIEANIPPELDLYIPAAQEELYNWVNGPNRQFEAAFRIIQSGEWGNYDGFYLMEGDSVPVKNYWLDVILGEINAYRPFAVLGA